MTSKLHFVVNGGLEVATQDGGDGDVGDGLQLSGHELELPFSSVAGHKTSPRDKLTLLKRRTSCKNIYFDLQVNNAWSCSLC